MVYGFWVCAALLQSTVDEFSPESLFFFLATPFSTKCHTISATHIKKVGVMKKID